MSLLVSVILPAYNSEKYIAQALASIFAQDYKNLEIIAVDDGSTDNTANILESHRERIKVIKQQNQGVGAARNSGVVEASGEYLTFLDADDTWEINKISNQVSYLETHREVDAIFGLTSHFVSPELSKEDAARFRCPETPVPGYYASTLMIRNKSFRKVGLFSREKVSEFIDWYMRAIDCKITFELQNKLASNRRIHLNNTGTRQKDDRVNYAYAIKQARDRRRVANT